ncbi:MAG: phytanoyl-CoA dioxygenase family protein [Rhodospirillaceae bacterium]|jgi:phytanoyl-CoA hydroxylase|nr:phytanoyl-CoA dioxygenase family protein [Rhodospirillaceae bacterium]MBT6138109.1 phytanoyl-CoA dioxygenase family protein [Rhodospirillaceae bacterium]
MITDAQVEFYRENGYVQVDNLYNDTEVARMRQVLAELVEGARGLETHNNIYDLEPSHTPDHPRVRRIKEPFKAHPVYRQMAEHPRLIECLEKLVSPDLVLQGGKINLKSAGIGSPVEWHQDWPFYPHTNDDLLAVGVMLDDVTEENGPLLVIPGSHKGPVYDHHIDGYFAGAMAPDAGEIDYDKAVKITGKAGSCSFHHVRLVHGSAQNMSGRDRTLLLYQVAAADAWDLRGLPSTWEEHESRVIAGKATIVPRLEPVPVRLPYPPARGQGSIYENQMAQKSRFFEFKPEAAE